MTFAERRKKSHRINYRLELGLVQSNEAWEDIKKWEILDLKEVLFYLKENEKRRKWRKLRAT
jgi:hypothetical protein